MRALFYNYFIISFLYLFLHLSTDSQAAVVEEHHGAEGERLQHAAMAEFVAGGAPFLDAPKDVFDNDSTARVPVVIQAQEDVAVDLSLREGNTHVRSAWKTTITKQLVHRT